MISYSQNFEDVMLERVFRFVSDGFYIDIGAQDPIQDSVSMHFYNKGWTGIDVEPVPYYANALRIARPRNEIFEMAVCDEEGPLDFFSIDGTGLSTSSSHLAIGYHEQGRKSTKLSVQTMTMDRLLNSANGRVVHWLKIDIEGAERSALSSWRNSPIRPRVILIEATQPGTEILSHKVWEQLLLDKGYQYIYGDGLNRFYLHQDHLKLGEFFKYPPNIFDNFELAGTASQPFGNFLSSQIEGLRASNQNLNAEIEGLRANHQNLNAETEELRASNQNLNAEIEELRASNQNLQKISENLLEQSAAKLNRFGYLNGHFLHLSVRKLKYLVIQLTDYTPRLQNQLRLLYKHGLKNRIIHANQKWRRRNVNFPTSLTAPDIGAFGNKSCNEHLIEIIKKKIVNNENSI